MPRKSNARRADGRCTRQVYLGVDPKTGKRITRSVYGSSEKEVIEKAEQLKLLHGRGIDLAARKDTFGSWADRWLRTRNCSQSRMNAYRNVVMHLSPYLEYTPIDSIRAADLQLIVNRIEDDAHLSRTTMTVIIQSLRQIFNLAIDNRVLDYNPAQRLTVPVDAAPPAKRQPLSDEQISWIIDTPHRMRIAAMTMLFCGLRCGEFCALRRSDIDLVSNILHVRRSITMLSGEEKEGGKSASAVRSVPIPGILHTALEEHFAEQDAQHVRRLDPLVLPSPRSGNPFNHGTWQFAWSRYMDALNLKYGYPARSAPRKNVIQLPMKIDTFTAHQLRHTYTTLLYESGTDVLTAQKLLGHSKPSITLDVYTHLRQDSNAAEKARLDDYIAAHIG